jgi:hypothetical protein
MLTQQAVILNPTGHFSHGREEPGLDSQPLSQFTQTVKPHTLKGGAYGALAGQGTTMLNFPRLVAVPTFFPVLSL